MKTINIHAAKTHLSRLIEEAANGEPFIIAKAGRPMVKVTRCEPSRFAHERFGFMKGRISVPGDFDTMYQKQIDSMFYGKK